jgi:FixJ family two-component response regulator
VAAIAGAQSHLSVTEGAAPIWETAGMNDHPRRPVIAVVDDDERILHSLESLLESADYDVRLFSSATALLESHCLRAIDCVISDVGMPVLGGLELARVLHAAQPRLPVILVTGRNDLLKRSPLDRLDGYRVFRKPFNGQELLSAVGDALGRS